MRLRASLLGAVIAALAAAAPAHAATYTVTGTADTAGVACSGTVCPTLRSAVTAAAGASGADTIKLTGGTYHVDLAVLTLADTVSIVGDTAQNTIIQSGGKTRVFIVTGAANKVTLSHLTLTGGVAASSTDGVGGDVHVTAGATLNTDHVRVTGGTAITGGGGIGIDTNSTAVIAESTIDTNTTQIPGVSSSGEGGGVASIGVKGGAGNQLTLTDSSVYSNTSSTSAGLAVSDNANNVTTITRSTIALNRASMGGGAGVWTNDTEKINVIGSIVAGNTGDGGASNCSRALTSLGGNIDTGNLCGFDKPNTDPQLDPTPVQFADTPMLTFPATSPAIDLIPKGSAACTGAITDQRDLARPQGANCDAGAFEIDTVAPDVTITAGPSGPTNNASPSFSFSSTDTTARFTCSLDAARPTTCTSPRAYSGLTDAAHTFTVNAIDPSNNSTSATRSFTVDTAAPPAPTITTPASNISQASATVALGGSAEPNSTVVVSEGASVRATVAANGQGLWSASFTAADGVHPYTANARDAAGNTSPASNMRTITVDTTAPDTTITSGPIGATNLSSPSFGFSSETGATFQCKLDGPGSTTGSYAACTSPKAYGPLTDGAYTFSVRAIDGVGNVDGSPATHAFTLDTIAPTVSVTSGPNGPSASTSASFGFTAETGSTTTCQMDTGAFASCTSPAGYSSLAQGSHTFTVRATDAAGNVGTATRTFSVDTVAPSAPAITTPASDVTQGSATVTVGGTAEPAATVQLFDNGAAKSSTTASGQGTWSITLNGVADGPHPYTAKATDAVGNVSVASNTRTVTVDTTAPETTITSGPAGATNLSSPSFGFSSETGATFQCKLDGPGATTGSYATCTSPKAYGPLADGVYTFSVRATDGVGNTDTTPATRGFTVDTAAPSVSVTSGPSGLSASTSASFGFTAETGATTTCQMDAGGFTSCTSPAAYSSLAQGSHTFFVRATDAAGNVGTASRTFTVDTIAPAVTITSGPSGATPSTSASFGFTAETGATTTCQMDAGAFTSCTSPAPYNGLSQGGHTFTVRATDAAGNSATDTRSFTVDTSAPAVTITSGPSGPTNSASPSFGFTADAGTTTTCQMDSGAFASCTSPASFSGLTQGPHTFTVRATDLAGNSGTDSRSFTVDTIAPAAPAITAPADNALQNSAAVTLSGTSEGSATITISEGATQRGTTTATAGGTWSLTLNVADGSHTYTATARDAAGNTSGASSARTVRVDTTAPAAPAITAPADNSLQNSAAVTLSGTSEGSATITISEGATQRGTTTATAGGTWSLTLNVADGSHTYTAKAADAAGNTSPASSTRTITVDTTAPNTTITGGPSGATKSTAPSFSFSSTEANSTFACTLTGPGQSGTPVACTSPKGYSGLADGAYTFSVRATDAAGNADATAATQPFTVDTAAPGATITGGPSGPTNNASPSFAFNAEAGATFECRLDGAAFTTCTSPKAYPGLDDGAHSFSVRATDVAGNTGTAATRNFTVDTATPAAPAITNAQNTGSTVTLSGTAEPSATVTVFDGSTQRGSVSAADDGSWTATLTTVPDGSHTYTAKATDAAGNTSGASNARTVDIDTGPPAAPVIGTPAATTIQNTHTVTLGGAAEAGSTVEVFDGAASVGTTTATADATWTLTLANVPDGTHNYTAKATDFAHNVSPASAPRTITVDTTPPPATVTTGPDGPTTDPSPSFTFGSSDSATTFDCKLDGPGPAEGAFGPCSSPKTFDALSPGDYTFSVRATDPAGNRTVTSRAFSVALVQQATPTPTPSPAPTPTPTPAAPAPVYQKTVVIQPAGGKTLVQLPGTTTFVPVDVTRGIPLGSIVDTRHSKIRLFAIPKPGKPAESALFYDGLFKVTQLANGVTQLVLVEQLAKCPTAKAASIATKKPKTRKLWGDGSGAFSTKGQYSAATVRGTKWLVQDSCGKTLTRVAKGVVSVQDLVKKKTVLVRAPKSYTALAKKKKR